MARVQASNGVAARWRRTLSAAGWPAGIVRGPAAGRLADAGLFLFAAGLGGLATAYLWHTHGELLDAVDLAAGSLACLALWLRRSRPVGVFVLAFGAGSISPLAAGASLVAICTAASRVRGRALIPVALLAAVGSIVFPLVNPSAGEVLQIGFPAFLFTAMAFGWGLYLRARRDLVASLRQRAEQLEADQIRNAELAREAERRSIAREMHDVLAHRLSLLSVHAGALEFNPDAPAAEIASAAAVIRTSASAALDDLREVITVLREEPDNAAGPPQPGLGQLDRLLEESRSAGMVVDARIDMPGASELPASAGRTAYRVVQEGLTNARKHAPGAPVEVSVSRDGEAGLVVEVISRAVIAAPRVPPPVVAGSGTGLIGLAERLALAGGDLEHRTTADGGFVLRAMLPGQR
jgi:signal transduction histidine kinase